MIGVFGGTFDPIHYGHLRTALDVVQGLGLAELRLLPLKVAVHRAQPVAGAGLRLAMTRMAARGQPEFVVDDRELTRDGPSYTVDTLTSLRDELGPDRPLCLLVGGDAFAGFFDWHRPRAILGLAHLVVMQRPGAATVRDAALRAEIARRRAEAPEALQRSPAGRIYFQTVIQLDISSTRIRRMLGAGLSPRFLLPDAVLGLIEREQCYGPGRPPTAQPIPDPCHEDS
jgi:nicotinate-nucleotide adenylyltransferase